MAKGGNAHLPCDHTDGHLLQPSAPLTPIHLCAEFHPCLSCSTGSLSRRLYTQWWGKLTISTAKGRTGGRTWRECWIGSCKRAQGVTRSQVSLWALTCQELWKGAVFHAVTTVFYRLRISFLCSTSGDEWVILYSPCASTCDGCQVSVWGLSRTLTVPHELKGINKVISEATKVKQSDDRGDSLGKVSGRLVGLPRGLRAIFVVFQKVTNWREKKGEDVKSWPRTLHLLAPNLPTGRDYSGKTKCFLMAVAPTGNPIFTKQVNWGFDKWVVVLIYNELVANFSEYQLQ